MSIVNNGRISTADQKVDGKKYADGMDMINFKGAPWRKKGKDVRSNKSK